MSQTRHPTPIYLLDFNEISKRITSTCISAYVTPTNSTITTNTTITIININLYQRPRCHHLDGVSQQVMLPPPHILFIKMLKWRLTSNITNITLTGKSRVIFFLKKSWELRWDMLEPLIKLPSLKLSNYTSGWFHIWMNIVQNLSQASWKSNKAKYIFSATWDWARVPPLSMLHLLAIVRMIIVAAIWIGILIWIFGFQQRVVILPHQWMMSLLNLFDMFIMELSVNLLDMSATRSSRVDAHRCGKW